MREVFKYPHQLIVEKRQNMEMYIYVSSKQFKLIAYDILAD